jgi:hypothetical protein
MKIWHRIWRKNGHGNRHGKMGIGNEGPRNWVVEVVKFGHWIYQETEEGRQGRHPGPYWDMLVVGPRSLP